MSTTGLFDPLFGEVRSALSTIDDPMITSFTALLDRSMGATPVLGPTRFPLGDVPDFTAHATDETIELARALRDASDEINWWQSDPDRVPPGWVHRSAATELIGPEGIIRGEPNARLGVFYLSPHLDYPDHWHNAEEFYFVVSGSAEWTISNSTNRYGPGDYPRTPSGATHRIVTASEPMLAIWGWSGDTSFDSYAY